MARIGLPADICDQMLVELKTQLPSTPVKWLQDFSERCQLDATADLDSNNLIRLLSEMLDARKIEFFGNDLDSLAVSVKDTVSAFDAENGPMMNTSAIIEIVGKEHEPLSTLQDAIELVRTNASHPSDIAYAFYSDRTLRQGIYISLILGRTVIASPAIGPRVESKMDIPAFLLRSS